MREAALVDFDFGATKYMIKKKLQRGGRLLPKIKNSLLSLLVNGLYQKLDLS